MSHEHELRSASTLHPLNASPARTIRACVIPSYFLLTSSFLLQTATVTRRKVAGIDVTPVAFVLPVEQLFQLFLQISSSAVLFRRFERIHGWPVVFPEFIHELRGRAGKVESKRVPREGDLLCRNTGARQTARSHCSRCPTSSG